MCTILLSINPVHVEKIFNGSKKYEFRKTTTKRRVDKIYIYCTNPVKKVVGTATGEEVLEDKPSKIWNLTKNNAGINKKFFDEYYKNEDKAIAYKLTNIHAFKTPKELGHYGINIAPQSFTYMD